MAMDTQKRKQQSMRPWGLIPEAVSMEFKSASQSLG